MMSKDKLPKSWALVRISDIATFIRGVSYSKADARVVPARRYTPILRANNIGRSLTFDHLVFVPDHYVAAEQIVREGDVVLAMSSGSKSVVGKAAQATNLPRCAFGAFCGVVRPGPFVDRSLFGHYFQTKSYRNAVSAESKGININNLKTEQILGRFFPLPPLTEQSRIASKVHALFGEIEEGERALRDAQKLIKRCRQSVLKAAVSGELTRDWRERHKGQLESGDVLLARILESERIKWERSELAKINAKGVKLTNDKWKDRYVGSPQLSANMQLPPLPDGWAWSTVAQAGDVRLGRQRAPQHHTGHNMRPYLRVANVYEDHLNLDDVKEMNFTPEEFETYALQPGDILLNEGQSPELVGRPAMYRGEILGCCYQKTLLRFRARQGIRPDFALLVFRYYLHSGRFRRSANITTSIAHLAAERFVQIEFPVPSSEEQSTIVEITTRFLAQLTQLEADLKNQSKKADGLRQSVLTAAFSGKIVPQNAADEPSSALVERLATQKAIVRPSTKAGRAQEADAA